jgi:threonine synthase
MKLQCLECRREYALEARHACNCGGSLEAIQDPEAARGKVSWEMFDERLRREPFGSGVWRYKELVLPEAKDDEIVSRQEGNTRLYSSKLIGEYTGVKSIFLKHEGENPTGSFKDRGMTVGITAARMFGMKTVACASTGNTSASVASYASHARMRCVVFVPEGEIAYGKLAQALAYGAKTLQVKGNFDDAMALVLEACVTLEFYLMNSLNPFRLEGQKTICFEALQQLDGDVPDWFVLPGGNLGNNYALSKALRELHELGLIRKIPRIAVVQARGANPLYRMWKNKTPFEPLKTVDTLASAIKIGNPVNWKKSLAGLDWCNGVVEEVSDQEILDAKAHVDRTGIGAEAASCATVAGLKKLVEAGVVGRDELVVGILTGHLLKDPNLVVDYHLGKLKQFSDQYANKPVPVDATMEAVRAALGDFS